MKKKKLFIIIGIVIVIIALIIAVFVFSKNYICEDGLTLLNELTLNDEEKEVLFALKDIDNVIQNPSTDETTDEEENTFDFISPSDATSIHDFITNIYEVRKHVNENGDISFLIDADTNFKGTIKKRKLLATKGHIGGITFDEEEINGMGEEKVERNDDGSLDYYFGGYIYEAITSAVMETWDSSTPYENVDYNKILKKI